MKKRRVFIVPALLVGLTIVVLSVFAFKRKLVFPRLRQDSGSASQTGASVPRPGDSNITGDQSGSKNVIVKVQLTPSWQPEGNLNAEERREQEIRANEAINNVLSGLDADNVYARWDSMALFAIKADEKALDYLEGHPLVASIQEDKPNKTHAR